jgi:hypothetical protein
VANSMETQILDISTRLERLEKENRRMKRVGVITVVFASVLFVAAINIRAAQSEV